MGAGCGCGGKIHNCLQPTVYTGTYIFRIYTYTCIHQRKQHVHLSLSGYLTGAKQPEDALGQRLLFLLRQQLLAVRDTVAAKPNALRGVQHWCLAHETLDATHAAVRLEQLWSRNRQQTFSWKSRLSIGCLNLLWRSRGEKTEATKKRKTKTQW